MKYLIGTLILFLLAACQDKLTVNNESPERPPVAKVYSEAKEVTDDKDQSFANLPCVNQSTINKSPPIKDKSKIKEMLIKSGKITTDMTPQQIDKTVNNYISKKNAAFNDCGKKG